MEYGGKSIIFYNDYMPRPHIEFSILHELGHTVNGHSLCGIDDETYGIYEVETNFFAAQLCMPEQLLRELAQRGQRVSIQFLIDHFGVSGEAAQKRIKTLCGTHPEWRTSSETLYDDIILAKYSAFLDSILPSKSYFSFADELDLQRRRESWY